MLGMMLLGCARDPEPPRAPRTGGPPNILLVTLDTTRADRLGIYGYKAGTSPNIDRVAIEGLTWDRAYSTSSWTLPTHASLFTARYPRTHGALSNPRGSLILADAVGGDHNRAYRADPLAEGPQTLAEFLAQAGYVTGGVVAGPWLLRLFGLDRGFADWDEEGADHESGRLGEDVTEAAVTWISEKRAEPFFLFLNYFDAHLPYQDPEELWREFATDATPEDPAHPERMRAGYDGEIRYMDRQLGVVFDHLRELELYDLTWIIITGDHGELFGEQGIHGHGAGLYEGELRVPLIVKPPRAVGARPGRSRELIQVTDIWGLLAAGLGLDAPEHVRERAAGVASPVFAEVYSARYEGPGWRAWYDDQFKLLIGPLGKKQLYNLERDPHETDDVIRYEPKRVASMTAALDAFVAALPLAAASDEPRAIDAKTRRALERLGYLE
jgi:arylsulfatase A-like enzyme